MYQKRYLSFYLNEINLIGPLKQEEEKYEKKQFCVFYENFYVLHKHKNKKGGIALSYHTFYRTLAKQTFFLFEFLK